MTLKEKYDFAIRYFEKAIPLAETELEYTNPFELLVATILSAQCTDKRINMVTPALFEKYPDAKAMSKAEPEDIFTFIRSVSYPNNKSKHLSAMARALVEDHGGKVPEDWDKLVKLPGVGRKTANVVASVAFDAPTMPVDTHVFRVSQRIGLVKKSKTPLEVEKQLLRHVPKELLGKFHHWLILHGRYTCVARSPKCSECGLPPICSYYKNFVKKSAPANGANKDKP